jgi:hypothetical protein
MANWCSNSVVFTGDDDKVKAIYNLFADMEAKQTQTGHYQLPEFAKDEKGVMVDIVLHKNGLSFETRWVPNLKLLIEIADFYQAGFVSKFEEMMMGIMGEARYDAGTLTMVSLDEADFRQIRYDAVKQGYPCNDQVFEYEGDLLDYILEQKKLSDDHVQIYHLNDGLENGR